jgi:hypothetical protein
MTTMTDTASPCSREYTVEEIKHSPSLLKFATNQTRVMCLEAIKKDFEMLEHVKEQTEELCWVALKINLFAYQHIRFPTKEMALYVVNKRGRMIVCLKHSQIDKEIYQTAFTKMDFGVGQAEAIVLFLIVAVVSLLQVYFTRKGAYQNER